MANSGSPRQMHMPQGLLPAAAPRVRHAFFVFIRKKLL